MAQANVTHLSCDRCRRLIGAVTQVSAGGGGELFIDATSLGLGEVRYPDLCDGCKATIKTFIDLIVHHDGDTEATSTGACADNDAQLSPPTANAPNEEQESGSTMKNEAMLAAAAPDRADDADDDEDERDRERERDDDEKKEDERDE